MRGEVREIGRDKQLFLDHTLAEKFEGVRLNMNPLQLTGEPLIVPDQPWETEKQARIGGISSVIREQGKFRLWYDYLYGEHAPWATGEKGRSMAYAESGDGISFTKPLFSMNPMPGHEKTNILIKESRGGVVWLDPTAPPERRYKHQCKYAFVVPGAKLEFFASPDGFQWEKTHVVDIGECDTANIAFWDDRYDRYVLYTRKWIRTKEDLYNRYRKVRRFESDDLIHWENEQVVWEADETDLSKYTPHTGQPGVDYYGATVFKYPEAGDLYVMLSPAFWHWKRRPEEERWGFSGDPKDKVKKTERLGPSSMDVRLGFSRDGIHFHRAVDRAPFMRQGLDGSFNSKYVWPLPNPVPMEEELWVYYAGHNTDHDGIVDPASPEKMSGISRAVMRMDGFVSADGDYTGGWLTTPPVQFEGEKLELNLDTSGGGSVKVEILDEGGKTIEGFSRDHSAVLCGNSVAMPVGWSGGGSVGKLAGRPIRLKFYMQDCKLYAFKFV